MAGQSPSMRPRKSHFQWVSVQSPSQFGGHHSQFRGRQLNYSGGATLNSTGLGQVGMFGRFVLCWLLTNSLVPRHGRRGEFHGLHKSMKLGETRKPRFSGFELTKSREGLCRQSVYWPVESFPGNAVTRKIFAGDFIVQCWAVPGGWALDFGVNLLKTRSFLLVLCGVSRKTQFVVVRKYLPTTCRFFLDSLQNHALTSPLS